MLFNFMKSDLDRDGQNTYIETGKTINVDNVQRKEKTIYIDSKPKNILTIIGTTEAEIKHGDIISNGITYRIVEINEGLLTKFKAEKII